MRKGAVQHPWAVRGQSSDGRVTLVNVGTCISRSRHRRATNRWSIGVTSLRSWTDASPIVNESRTWQCGVQLRKLVYPISGFSCVPISRDRFLSEGRAPHLLKANHLQKVTAILFGRRVDISSWPEAVEFCVPSPIAASDFDTHDEDVVKQAVRLALEDGGWQVTEINWGEEQGVDIVAERPGVHMVIEAKGTRQRGPGIRHYTFSAIAQVVIARVETGWQSGLAFPALKGYVNQLRKLPHWFWSVMNLTVFLVKKEKDAYSVAEIRVEA